MTSKLKCPVCQKATLVRLVNPLTGEEYEDCHCPNRLCNFSGNLVAVEALTQSQRDLQNLKQELTTGNLSDGYHTHNELYRHRMCLFAVIVKQNKSLAWKSKLHSDGTMFDDYFIVGINTPDGQATYHYHIDHWNMFDCVELSNAPEWDGHTADDVLKRLLSLTKSNN